MYSWIYCFHAILSCRKFGFEQTVILKSHFPHHAPKAVCCTSCVRLNTHSWSQQQEHHQWPCWDRTCSGGQQPCSRQQGSNQGWDLAELTGGERREMNSNGKTRDSAPAPLPYGWEDPNKALPYMLKAAAHQQIMFIKHMWLVRQDF